MTNNSTLETTFEEEKKLYEFASLFIALIVVSVAGNVFVCFILLQGNLHIMGKSTSILVVSLALSDIGVATTIMPLRIVEFLKVQLDQSTCVWFVLSDVFVSTVSVVTQLTIALDRYLMITMPYHYQRLINTKRVVVVAVAVWMYAGFSASFSPFRWSDFAVAIQALGSACNVSNKKYVITLYSVNFFIPLLLISFLYIKLFRISRGHWHEIRSSQPAVLIQSRDEQGRSISINSSNKRAHRATRTVMIVYGTFFLCWFPNFFIIMLYQVRREIIIVFRKDHPELFTYLYNIFMVVLPPLNSLCNPFIYGVYHTAFRQAVSRFFKKKRDTYSVSNESNNVTSSGGRFSKISTVRFKRVPLDAVDGPECIQMETVTTAESLTNGVDV